MKKYLLSREENVEIVGNHLFAYKKIYMLLMGVISIFELIMMIRGIFVFNFAKQKHLLYFLSYTFLLVVSLATGVFLWISRKRTFKTTVYSNVLHGYALAVILWSLMISYLDLMGGVTPIVYITVIVTLAGVVILEPTFFIPLLLLSFGALIALDSINGFKYFISSSEYINFVVFLSMALIIDIRHYLVSVKELKDKNKLEIAVENERHRVSDISLQTIMSISNAVDAKDKYTRAHSQRVAEYSKAIAEAMGWDEASVKELHEIALLHDIGKIGVPDSILNYPGRLTDEQFKQMKNHTVIGGEILKDLTILKNVDLGAKYHHERFDGTGYPSKLKGTEIPIEARIIAVADAFDAMNSNRIYRNKLTKEKIMDELVEGKGKQFDPDIIDLFLPYAKKILEIEVK